MKWLRLFFLSVLAAASWNAAAEEFRKAALVTADTLENTERNIINVLAERLRLPYGIEVKTIPQRTFTGMPSGEFCILFGLPDQHPCLLQACQGAGLDLPTVKDPGPEGFLLKALSGAAGTVTVLAAGVDERGLLYAAGELLRRITMQNGAAIIPEDLDVRTAPAFEIRGTEVSQGHTMRMLTGARIWSEEEWRNAVLEYALAGANTFAIGHASPSSAERYNFLKSYGLKTMVAISPSQGTGPPAWAAVEPIGRQGHLCPSIPEARAAILAENEARWSNSVQFDYVRFYAGDGGGCICEQCAPYGKTYIHMCEALAEIILNYQPATKIFATNQKLDNAGDQAIFDYLNEAPRLWLTGLCYGPGSNAMSWQPGRRNDHRMDLYRYPGFGEYDRYLQEIIHELPPRQTLLFFSDLTHWVYSEYGLVDYAPIPDINRDTPPHWSRGIYAEHPDPALYMVYDRRTFHARPRHFYRVFRETMRYGIGDVTYSEGHHDHFNQWMWQRLLWNPNLTVEQAVAEYARNFFGPEAAEPMTRAIFQLEENLSVPLAENAGVDRYCQAVREAGTRMPEAFRNRNALWREYLQKGVLDKYCQELLRQQLDIKTRVEQRAAKALEDGNLEPGIAEAGQLLQQNLETPEMAALKEEARILGEESDRLLGVRNEGYFHLGQDFAGLGWLRRQAHAAAKAENEADRRAALRMIPFYEDPGPGGFYDDAGDPARSPHLVYGWPYCDGEIAGANRPSQRSMAFTAEEPQGVTFAYRGLERGAAYRLRAALVRPYYEPRFAATQIQKSESIYADDICLTRDLALPEFESGLFEFDVPPECTRDGKLTIRFEKSPGVGEGTPSQVALWRNCGGWGTLVSDIWLMKK